MNTRQLHIHSLLEDLSFVVIKYDYFFEGHIKSLFTYHHPIFKIIELPDQRVVTCSRFNVRIFDLNTNNPPIDLQGSHGHIFTIFQLPNTRIAVIFTDGSMHVWDLDTMTYFRHTSFEMDDFITHATILPDNTIVLVNTRPEIVYYDYIDDYLQKYTPNNTVTALISQGTKLIVGIEGGPVEIHEDMEVKFRFPYTGKITLLTKISEDIVIGVRDMILIVFDLVTHKLIDVLKGHTSLIKCVALLSNGTIVSGSSNGHIILWDLDRSQIIHDIHVSYGPIDIIDVLPNNHIVTGSTEDIVQMWDPSINKRIHAINPGGSSTITLKVLSTGKILISSEDDSKSFLTLMW